jgi:hypothetical protein
VLKYVLESALERNGPIFFGFCESRKVWGQLKCLGIQKLIRGKIVVVPRESLPGTRQLAMPR